MICEILAPNNQEFKYSIFILKILFFSWNESI